MATLSQADLDSISAEIQRDRNLGTLSNIVKSDLLSAVAAADAWVNANSVSYNNALPLTARTNMTTTQKTLLLFYVVSKRYLSGG